MRTNSESIEELENDYWEEESEFPTNLVKRCFEYRKIKISDLSIEQMRLLISQNIGIKYLIVIALEKLSYNIISQGDLYEGDLLDAVSRISTKFWKGNESKFEEFKNIFNSNKEKIKTELGDKEFELIKKRINSNDK